MLWRKMFRTIKLYKAQFISMIIMIALGVGIFVGFNTEWVSINSNTESFFEQTGFADYRILSESGFTQEDLNRIKDIKGVENAARYISVNADIKERSGDSAALTVTTDGAVSSFVVAEGEKYDPKSSDGIWLSDKYAFANNVKTGDTLTFQYKGAEICGVVRGLIKSGEYMICVQDESQLMPDHSVYGFAYISPKLYESVAGADFYPQINVISKLDKKEFVQKADEALGSTALILTKKENISYSGASGEVEEGQTMGTILPVLFLLIAVLTMVTTMHRLAAKEKTQIGTLKALGFKDKRILRHYTSYAALIGLVGTAIGIALGYLIAWVIMNPSGMMGTYLDMPEWRLVLPQFCYIALAAILILMTVIGYFSVRHMLKGTAADALRPYSPKKMKPMLIEKTKLFHKLPFGTRWNMRDSMRHKSRSAMSLIGIAGCTVLIIASLGMSDTMHAFLDLYYDGAINYSSRIYLSEEASEDERANIVEKYNGDYSASISVQLEEKAVSLDVFNIKSDTVRFPDENNGYISLENSGAYICMRIADEFGLSVGDSFTVSPYGSDKKYTMTVAGIVRSVSQSIAVTYEYAESIGIEYIPDSVYTAAEKADIPSESAVKSVQSKQSIVESFDSFIEIMNIMIIILIAGALILGTVVLYNLGVMSYTERYREMATLKVVGFKDRKIGRLLIGQNLWMSVIGIAVGIPAGIGALGCLLKALGGEYEMKLTVSALTIIATVILTAGMSLAVSITVARKNKNIDMVEALKGSE